MSTEIILTDDGSHSLLNTTLNETYHSRHGALQESQYVFIKQGLTHYWEKTLGDPVQIFEVGFGTGLNALLTLDIARKTNRNIHYTTLEAFPLHESIWSKLNYGNHEHYKSDFRQLHEIAWMEEVQVCSAFALLKIKKELQSVIFPESAFDLIYFDAFAPSKQPELWHIDILRKIQHWMRPSGVFVTYCAKGQLKRDLKELGFFVETLQGPPGKKEMVRATKR